MSVAIDTDKQTPFAWIVRGLIDDDGDRVGDLLKWTKPEAERLALYHRNGLKRSRPGYLLPLYLDEDHKE